VQHIVSRQNGVVKEYRDAARGEVPDTVLLDGQRLITEALTAGVRLRHVMVAADAVEHPDIVRLLKHVDTHLVTVASASAAVMDAVSPVRSTSGIVALAARPAFDVAPYAGADPMVVVVCDMQNPGNVGAIVRVAEAAGATSVVIAGLSADPFGWKALRGSMGSALRMPISLEARTHDAVTNARHHGASVVATVPRNGLAPSEARLAGPIAVLIGGEGIGLTPDVLQHADQHVSIPMQPPVESLNAAVASAVLLYEARRQRTARAGG
jgi:TrmH family RNA methyltransferase